MHGLHGSLGATHVARSIRVRGLVQGVGFRPFVWQLARAMDLSGHVANDAEGVIIAVQGPADAVDAFALALRERAPLLSRVMAVEVSDYDGPPLPQGFTIHASAQGRTATGIVPDAATCPDCRAEVFDEANRRHGYAFGNCTHCGPRLTIIRSVPYDRASTSMAAFPMCADCRAEYADPADRRFHAQPVACPQCGPRLWLESDEAGEGDPLEQAARLLEAGRIVAIKGLGGFHLACLADDDVAVARLRSRKRRDAKPFAVMVGSVGEVAAWCRISPPAKAALESPAAPIVLCPLLPEHSLPEMLAPDQDHLGIMLPYTPLHHLLMARMGRPLVMTSGNRSEEPQVTDNAQALAELGGIADAFLMHDREIVNRIDDSVIAFDASGPVVLRRARGFAPDPVLLDPGLAGDRRVLAMGGELKATFCLLNGREAVLSQHIGDLEDAGALADYRSMLELYRRLYDFVPDVLAVDAHPDYLSTQLGRALAAEMGIEVIAVPHHHAHLASCLAENGVAAGTQAGGIVCDGLGYGADGTLWGGEVLLGDYATSTRIAALPAVALAGGAAAIKQPWRNLVAHLASAFGPDWRSVAPSLARHLPDEGQVRVIEQMIAKGINAPACSSAGRLFDAVAATLGVHPLKLSHEGQVAMALEALARPHTRAAQPYPYAMCDEGDITRPDLAPMWQAIAHDVDGGSDTGVIAARFHATLAAIMLAGVSHAQPAAGTPVALSGGVLLNRVLREILVGGLQDMGLKPLVHTKVPASDGGLSLGQAACAAAMLQAR